jgi:RNA polymerase sigma factor (sigma-70 family)
MSTNPLQWIEPILDRYERPLLQYAASICGNAENARDVVQDTFVKLVKHGEPAADHLAPWLFTVCRNRALDWRRKEERIMPTTHQSPEPHSEEPGPAATLQQKEATERLGVLLEHLPENQREVIRLRFQCDLSYREISEITQLGVGNVGFLIHTGLKKLRQLWPENLEVNS